MHCEKDLKDNKDNSLHLGQKYAGIFVLGHYLFLVAHSRSQKTVRFSEQIMSMDKYPSIFSGQMATIVYIFDRIVCFSDFSPMRTLCDEYHKEFESH